MLEVNIAGIPEQLKQHPYWNGCLAVSLENGRISKPPVHPSWKLAKTSDLRTWVNFDAAYKFYHARKGQTFNSPKTTGKLAGIGILLADGTITTVDIDHCIRADGTLEDWAQKYVKPLSQITYGEISISGTGLHFYILASKNGLRCRHKEIEIYDKVRFMVVTGHIYPGAQSTLASGEDVQAILNEIEASISGNDTPPLVGKKPEPAKHISDDLSDSDIIAIMDKAKNGYKFRKLYYDGDCTFLKGDTSNSGGRITLANMLAWYTNDPAQIFRIIQNSALIQEPEYQKKWARIGMQECQDAITKHPKGYKPPREKTTHPQGRERKTAQDANTGANKGKNEYVFTEDALALIFESKYRDTLRYDHTRKTWYGWNGKYWQVDDKGRAFDRIRDICRNAAKEVSKQEAFYLKKASTTSAVNKFAQCAEHLAVTHEIWDSNDFLLGTPGGIVDLKTGQLMPGKRELYISRITAIAPADKADAPLWLKFLAEATNGDADLQRYLQQIAGMCLTGCTREHALFFVYGDGGNGKSVFLNTLRAIIGQYATTAQMETFTASKNDRHPAELAALNGARLVTVSETEEGRAWAEVKVKQFTGGDPMTARYMRGNPFEFKPKAKLIIIGNHKPALRNVDDAMRRRLNIIPFIHKPEKVDEKLPEKLQAEYPAILRWAIDGCLDWQENGLQRPDCVTKTTQEYFEDQDSFGEWLKECCVKYDGFTTKGNTLFASWKEYAEKCGIYPGNAKSFAGEMQKRGFERDRDSKGARGFKGITLKPEENQGYERGCPQD